MAGAVLVTAWLLTRERTGLFKAGIAIHLVAVFVLHNFTVIAPAVGIEPGGKLDPLRRVRGWDVMGDSVAGLRAQAPDARLLFDDRKTMATLVYYVRPHPFAARMWNADGSIDNHYELEMALSESDSGPFLYLTRNHDPDHVLRRFAEAEQVSVLRVTLSEDEAIELYVWRLDDFKGYDT